MSMILTMMTEMIMMVVLLIFQDLYHGDRDDYVILVLWW